ncbi:MAG: tRNA (adenosine(37)-N6)-threonylcarbamoyltransferase complex ATPase subunit type 1 TsaE [Rhodobacteraceae bacterium]|nr:tRNA (adenosine(37)-N6)-threonylcarbamoyltransferase complex ATPase subunit type 1 TsaE [Paracoccaceae bacterium]
MRDAFISQAVFNSPDDTASFAAALAPLLCPGDTILLEGPIGAGKSHFARAVIQTRLANSGKIEDVPSPTFTLVQTYDDVVTEIWHADLYRLTGIGDVDELGLWDAFGTAICLVEWPDRLGSLAPSKALTIKLEQSGAEGVRIAHFSSPDPAWQKRLNLAGLHDED